MSYHDRKTNAQARAAEALTEHQMKDSLVRSFRFGKEKSSVYAFTLTWTPGQLVLTGDCGELTLTHYHALRAFREGIEWAVTPDFDYLLGKSNAKQEYDRGATFAWFKQTLNEEPLNAVLGHMNWVDGKLRRVAKHSQIRELRAWRKTKPRPEDHIEFDTELREWQLDRPEDLFRSPEDDAWHWWRKVAEVASVYKEQYDITKAEDRHDILYQVSGNFDDEHSAADFLWADLGYDDPDIVRAYSAHAFFQIAIIQHGCRMILDSGAR